MRQKKERSYLVLGIDPDVDKSGVAIYSSESQSFLSVECLGFAQLLDRFRIELDKAQMQGIELLVAVEAGYLVQSNWHLNHSDSKRTASAKGNSAGRNHQTARLLVECAKHIGLPTVEIKPLRKLWRGKDHKITSDEFRVETGYLGRTNQEMRDAGLIALSVARNYVYYKSIALTK